MYVDRGVRELTPLSPLMFHREISIDSPALFTSLSHLTFCMSSLALSLLLPRRSYSNRGVKSKSSCSTTDVKKKNYDRQSSKVCKRLRSYFTHISLCRCKFLHHRCSIAIPTKIQFIHLKAGACFMQKIEKKNFP